MRPVNKSPALPNPSPRVEDTVKALTRAIFTEFTEHANRLNAALPVDGTEPMTGPLALAQYTTVNLPAAASNEGAIVYDSTTNTVKFSNGAVWTSM